MDRIGIHWYMGHTDEVVRSIAPGVIARVSFWLGTCPIDNPRDIRIITEPESQMAVHAHVDGSIFRRREWMEFQIAFGELVYNHNQRLFPPDAPPDWKVYFHPKRPHEAVPVALVWRLDGQDSVAAAFCGEPGQSIDELRQELVGWLPEPEQAELPAS